MFFTKYATDIWETLPFCMYIYKKFGVNSRKLRVNSRKFRAYSRYFAKVRRLFAIIREKYNFFLDENEPNRLSFKIFVVL